MRNLSTSKVPGVKKVTMKMTFEKLLPLNNVFHVADIKKVQYLARLKEKLVLK
jgi:hypothetical protein